jgi:peptidoglycan/xylan/chitin deacetylase (PgdA/CDA1 family)
MAIRHPRLVREIAARGHGVENHTYRHSVSFACWSPGAMLREIKDAQCAIADACGQEPAFFRAPAGIRSPLLDPVLAVAGLRLVSWTRRGYDAMSSRPDLVYARLTRGLTGGDILLLHDGRISSFARTASPLLAMMPRLLARLQEDRLSSVSLRMALSDELGVAAGARAIAPACPKPAGYASR